VGGKAKTGAFCQRNHSVKNQIRMIEADDDIVAALNHAETLTPPGKHTESFPGGVIAATDIFLKLS
jgi:hypothetical protein